MHIYLLDSEHQKISVHMCVCVQEIERNHVRTSVKPNRIVFFLFPHVYNWPKSPQYKKKV